jgi:hypothetical protein
MLFGKRALRASPGLNQKKIILWETKLSPTEFFFDFDPSPPPPRTGGLLFGGWGLWWGVQIWLANGHHCASIQTQVLFRFFSSLWTL